MDTQKINFHVHSTGSDGKMTPEEAVKEAIKSGIKYMCFTDHYRVPENTYAEKRDFHSQDYVKEVRRLQKAYKDKIDIAFGAEFDWLEGYEGWTKEEISKEKYDYLIGSIHLHLNKQWSALDFGKKGKEKFLRIAELFGGVEKLVKSYYSQVRLLAESRLFDSVGHFDIIKLYNENSELFSEDEDWYKEAVLASLDSIAKAKMAIEINIHGLHKVVKAQYPSLWILREAKKRNIPVTIGTDAHLPGEVNQDLDKAYELAKQAGYKEIVRFKARKMISIKI